uniref:lipopolysaccharide biosynthesis protein n=1 Tax=uncultured Draconibacterium sp. TaxID=1573823 RepID=UPI00321748E5
MKKALISVTFFNILGAGLGFIINVLIARIFPVEVFGRINLLLSISTISMTIFEFGYFNSLVIFYNKQKIKEYDQDLLNLITRKYFLFLLKIIPLYGLILFFIDKYYSFSFWEFVFLISSALFLVLYRFFTTYYQALGRWSKYNLLNISYSLLKGGILLIGGAIAVYILKCTPEYELYLKLYILYAISLLIFGFISSYNQIGIQYSNNYDDKLLKKTILSIGITNIIIALSMRLDNVIIEYFLGAQEVGVYAAANTLALAFPLITGSIMRVFMREASNDSINFLNKILKFQKKYFIHLLGFIIVVILLSPHLIEFLFGEKYINSIPIFQILIVAYIGGVFFTPLESFFYNENSNLILRLKFIQLILFLIGSVCLIKVFSLVGVALTVVLTRVFAWIFLSINSYKQISNYNSQNQV